MITMISKKKLIGIMITILTIKVIIIMIMVPIYVTVVGILTDTTPLLRKALLPIDITDVGIMIVFNDLHP